MIPGTVEFVLPILSCFLFSVFKNQDQRSDDVEYVLWFSLLRVEIFVIRRSHFSFVKNEACNLSYVLSMFFFLRSYEFSTITGKWVLHACAARK